MQAPFLLISMACAMTKIDLIFSTYIVNDNSNKYITKVLNIKPSSTEQSLQENIDRHSTTQHHLREHVHSHGVSCLGMEAYVQIPPC